MPKPRLPTKSNAPKLKQKTLEITKEQADAITLRQQNLNMAQESLGTYVAAILAGHHLANTRAFLKGVNLDPPQLLIEVEA